MSTPTSALSSRRERISTLVLVALLHILLLACLFLGLRADFGPRIATLPAIMLTAVPPPRALERDRQRAMPRHQGAAAPPHLRARATPVARPQPVIAMPAPPIIVAAPLPGLGAEATAGAAAVIGPGSGSGGIGAGTGSGGGGGEIPLRLIHGRIRDSDYPLALADRGIAGTVGLRFVVGVDGRVGDCVVTATSGSPELDALTCRLIRERFRYRPTRNGAGRKVADVVTGEHHWTVVRGSAEEP